MSSDFLRLQPQRGRLGYAFDGIVVDPQEHQVSRNGIPIPLEPKVFDTLLVLLHHAGRLVDKHELMRSVWPDSIVEEGNLARNVSVLRKALGVSPGGAPYIETVPKRGYRFVGAIRSLAVDGSLSPDSTRVMSQSPTAAEGVPATVPSTIQALSRRRPRSLVATGALLLAALTAVAALLVGRPQEQQIDSLAVTRFVNASGDADLDYLAAGLADELTHGMARLPGLRVASRTAASRHQGLDAAAAGRALQVDAVLAGRLVTRQGRLEVDVELITPRDERHLWERRYTRGMTDLPALQEEILADLAARLRPTASGAETRRAVASATSNSEAHELYLKGRFHLDTWDNSGILRGLDYLERATRVDPLHAPAWAALAEGYTIASNLGTTFLLPPAMAAPKAKAAALRALELDPHLSAALSVLGQIETSFDWNWGAAETAFRAAVGDDPRTSGPPHWYSHYLIATGRLPESRVQSVQALATDPLDVGMQVHLGFHHYMAGELDLAMAQLQLVLAQAPHPEAHNILGLVYAQRGLYDEAVEEMEKGLALGGVDSRGDMGFVHGRAGRREAARRILAELLAAGERAVSPYQLAKVHVGLGELDETFALLERAYESHDPHLAYLMVDPQFAILRGDPRFDHLLRRLGLPYTPGAS